MRSTTLCALLLATGPALAQTSVPPQLAYEGRLAALDGGAPITGTHSIKFAIWPSPTPGSGSPPWSDTLSPMVVNGLYSVTLGTTSGDPFPPTLFDGSVLYLELTVDGDTLAPRQPIGSVPYAILAGAVQGGPVNATSYALNGSPFATATGRTLLSYTPDGGTTSTKSVSGLFCGASPSITNGALTDPVTGAKGYLASKLICQGVCKSQTAHMCSAPELIGSMELGVSALQQAATAADLWYSAGVDIPYSGLPTNDCGGWTLSSGAWGPAWASPGVATLDLCGDTELIACCD